MILRLIHHAPSFSDRGPQDEQVNCKSPAPVLSLSRWFGRVSSALNLASIYTGICYCRMLYASAVHV